MLIYLMPDKGQNFDGKTPLNVTDKFIKAGSRSHSSLGRDNLKITIFFWIRKQWNFPSEIPGETPIEILFHGTSLFGELS